ncbi:hypothetical protein [Ornithinimicrobium sp. W1665]|uniref:hypothetical protein n=1 Tax=Ornithinimicrobium sp. W1665 TaxID=3416666 RepID=UPI003CF53FE5
MDTTADACRCPGQSADGYEFAYFMDVCFYSDCTTDTTVTVTRVYTNVDLGLEAPQTLLVPAGGFACLTQDVWYSSNSNVNVNVDFFIGDASDNILTLGFKAPVQECTNCAGTTASTDEATESARISSTEADAQEEATAVEPAPTTVEPAPAESTTDQAETTAGPTG